MSALFRSAAVYLDPVFLFLFFARSFSHSSVGHVWVIAFRCGVSRKMTSNLALGIKEVHQEHSGDESDEDVDDVVEQSPCGRWEKRRQEVYMYKLIDLTFI